MFISLTNIIVPATSGAIDIDLIMAEVDAVVPSRTDVVAVSSFDGTVCAATAKNPDTLRDSMLAIVTGFVDGAERNLALWSFQVSQPDNYFLFYRIL